MRNPVETVRGKIVGYDHRTSEFLIRAPYDDVFTMCKREYKECLVQPIDSRPLSDKQRRMVYALLREVSEYTGQGMDSTKEWLKIKFITDDLEQTADKIFSLSNAPMSLVSKCKETGQRRKVAGGTCLERVLCARGQGWLRHHAEGCTEIHRPLP